MHGHCKECGKLFGSFGTVDRDGKLIMFEGCEHIAPRGKYKVVSFQEVCGPTYPLLETKLKQLQLVAMKEDKELWIQLRPTDLRNHPRKPEDVSRMDIKFSSMPYQIADVVTLVFDDKTEMRLAHRGKRNNEN